MARNEDVREKIVEAAEHRLWHYGFKKTTIDEIASDAGVGKGTVYLHFDSKEDVALAIMAKYKEQSLQKIAEVVQDGTKSPIDKLKEMLRQPLVDAYEKCLASPASMEFIVAIKPHIREMMLPYSQREYALLASVLEEGNQSGVFDVPDTLEAARTLKIMCLGLLPPYPCVTSVMEIAPEIDKIVDLTTRGLRK